MSKRIKARVIDESQGLLQFESVVGIRIRSDKYGLLIMEDYLPSLGKVHGDVVILTEEKEVPFRNIDGFYKHQHNVFTLLIKSYFEKTEGNG